jgi:hypothetical protein
MTDLILAIETVIRNNPSLIFICIFSLLFTLLISTFTLESTMTLGPPVVVTTSNSVNAPSNRDEDSKSSNAGSPKAMSGTFEIHITVDPKNNYVKLLDFIEARRFERKFKLVYAVSSSESNQYMLSYFTHKSDDRLAVNSALDIAKELEKNNIEVVRVKVEAHDASGIPITDREYRALVKHLIDKYSYESHKQYFEFHCKVNHSELDLEQLEKDINDYKGTGISYNLCSSNKNPLLTIRAYDVGLTNAIAYKNTVMNHLKRYGYIFEDKIQQEFAVYDTNTAIDDWL